MFEKPKNFHPCSTLDPGLRAWYFEPQIQFQTHGNFRPLGDLWFRCFCQYADNHAKMTILWIPFGIHEDVRYSILVDPAPPCPPATNISCWKHTTTPVQARSKPREHQRQEMNSRRDRQAQTSLTANPARSTLRRKARAWAVLRTSRNVQLKIWIYIYICMYIYMHWLRFVRVHDEYI